MTTLQANNGFIATVKSNTNHLVSKKAEAGAECCICFTKFNEEEICIGHTVSNVDHVFHKECLKGWWDQGKRSCPVCRAHLTDSENKLNTDPENGLNTDPENGLTGSQRRCIGVALSVLCALLIPLCALLTSLLLFA